MARMSEKIILAGVRFLGGGAGIVELRLAALGFCYVAKDGDRAAVACSFPGGAKFSATARLHFEPKENRLGVRAALDSRRAAPAQDGVDGNGARAGIRNRLQKGRSVGDLDTVEKPASQQFAGRHAKQGLAIRTDRCQRARPVATGDEAAHGRGEIIVLSGPGLLRPAAQAPKADKTGP